MPTLHLLFSHTLTEEQKKDAQKNLGIETFVSLPDELQKQFSAVPPDLKNLKAYLKPFKKWIAKKVKKGDYLLIQGDFGVTYKLVRFAKKQNAIPVYATTERKSVDEKQADGSIVTKRVFKHCLFRKY